MTTVEQFLQALASVESSNNPQAWGDDGRAMGRWQVHPDRVWSESRLRRVAPNLGETWDSWIGRILTVIFNALYPVELPVSIAMYWHLGHFSDPGKPDWDSPYNVKFDAALKATGSDCT